jgi:hypothetical protein
MLQKEMKSTNGIKNTLLSWWHFFIYKPDSKDIYWEKIISSLIVITGFFIWICFNQKDLKEFKEERDAFGRYTIGVTTGSHQNVRGSRVIDYIFKANGLEISDSYSWNWPVTAKGGRYYIKYSSKNPSNSEILFDHPMPADIISSPDSSWNYMPGYEILK